MSATTFQFVPTMRRVEKSAWNTLRKCAKAKKLTTLPLPVPVEEWVEGPLEIRLELVAADVLGANVLGLAMTKDRTIRINESVLKRESRYRFTVAHELGHIVLHHKVAPEFREMEWADFLNDRIEREADRFAAAFLMPIPVFSEEYVKLTADCGVEPVPFLAAVNAKEGAAPETFRSRIAPALAARFGTSLSATIRRFSDMKLPNGTWALGNQVARELMPQPDGSGSLFSS